MSNASPRGPDPSTVVKDKRQGSALQERESSGNANLSGSDDSFDFEKGVDRTP